MVKHTLNVSKFHKQFLGDDICIANKTVLTSIKITGGINMKVKNKSRFFIFTLAILLTTVMAAQFDAEKVHALSYGQEILITEVMPMSQTNDDSYEYIELYNNSDKAINIKDYKLQSPNNYITFSKSIQPRGILVVCTKFSTTLEEFNKFYNTTLTADKFAVLPLKKQ
jgi:hypothetical protein